MSERRHYTRPYPEAFRRDAVALVASSGRFLTVRSQRSEDVNWVPVLIGSYDVTALGITQGEDLDGYTATGPAIRTKLHVGERVATLASHVFYP